MASLTVTIKPGVSRSKKFLIELDAEKFERLAANLGFFSPDFLESLDRSERDYKAGRVKKIKSLKELRKWIPHRRAVRYPPYSTHTPILRESTGARHSQRLIFSEN